MIVCLYSVIDSIAASHPVRREFESPLRLSSPNVTLSATLLSPSSNPLFNFFKFFLPSNKPIFHPY